MNVDFIRSSYQRFYRAHRTELLEAVDRCAGEGEFLLRDEVLRFEENLCRLTGYKYAVAVSSGTDALYLALKAFEVGVGDDVITSGHTFHGTIEAITLAGAHPVIADYDEDWKQYGTRHTKVVMPVHIAGQVSEWRSTYRTIHDSCQALGAKLPKGDAHCFSFYPAKILGGWGDNGGVVTDAKKIAENIRDRRNHFKEQGAGMGVNARMDNIQAAILNVKFKYLPELIKRREEIAHQYLEAFKELPLLLPDDQKGRVWQDFIIGSSQRNQLHEYLESRGIQTMKNHYPFPKEIGKKPKAEKYESETLRLPLNPEMTKEEVEYVIQNVRRFFAQ